MLCSLLLSLSPTYVSKASAQNQGRARLCVYTADCVLRKSASGLQRGQESATLSPTLTMRIGLNTSFLEGQDSGHDLVISL